MSGYIDPKRAAVVAEIAGMRSNAEREGWLIERVLELEGSLQTLWSAVAKYNSIGHEGSELLEVMSDAKSVLAARTQEPTPQQVAEIRARADAASPGPWRVIDDELTISPRVEAAMQDNGIAPFVAEIRIGIADTAANSRLIASARTDVPRLCDTIDALRGEVERLKEDKDRLDSVFQRGWCIVPPNQETDHWTVFKSFDGEFGYQDEIGCGVTVRDAIDAAANPPSRMEVRGE